MGRVALVAGIGTMMSAFIAANPTLLKRHFRARPTNLVTDWPCSYLDLRPVSVHWDNSLRVSLYSPSIVFVSSNAPENEVDMDFLDSLVDAFNDHLDSYAHIIPGTSWSDGSWSEESVPLSDATSASAVRWTFSEINIADPRL